MAHLVAGDVDRHQRIDRRTVVAVAEGHAEAAVAPERVGVVAAVVDAAEGTPAGIVDAVAAVHGQEVVPGLGDAELRIHRDRLRIAGQAIAPGVVGIGEHGAVAGGLHRHVGDVATAAGRIAHLVAGGAALGGGQGHAADHQRRAGGGSGGAGAGRTTRTRARGVDLVPLVQHLAVRRVDDVVHDRRGLVGLHAVEHDLMGQDRRGTQGVHDLARGGRADERAAEAGTGFDDRLVGADAAGKARAGAGLQGLADLADLAIARLQHEVAADHRQALVGALEAHVFGAVGIDHHVAGDEAVGAGAAHACRGGTCDQRVGAGNGGGLLVAGRFRGSRHGKPGNDGEAQQGHLDVHGGVLRGGQDRALPRREAGWMRVGSGMVARAAIAVPRTGAGAGASSSAPSK